MPKNGKIQIYVAVIGALAVIIAALISMKRDPTPPPLSSSVIIDSINPHGVDYVIIKNTSSAKIDVAGYTLFEKKKSYEIPNVLLSQLEPNALLKICFVKENEESCQNALNSKSFHIKSGETIDLFDKSNRRLDSKKAP